MMPTRPMRYFIEYTPRAKWEALHRTGEEPAEADDFRDYVDVRTLRQARKQARELLEAWPFAQPSIRVRTTITAVAWDYTSEAVAGALEEEEA